MQVSSAVLKVHRVGSEYSTVVAKGGHMDHQRVHVPHFSRCQGQKKLPSKLTDQALGCTLVPSNFCMMLCWRIHLDVLRDTLESQA